MFNILDVSVYSLFMILNPFHEQQVKQCLQLLYLEGLTVGLGMGAAAELTKRSLGLKTVGKENVGL